MDFNKVAGEVERRDHTDFQAEVEKLINEAEAIRLDLMKIYDTRHMIAVACSIIFVLMGSAAFGWYLLYEGQVIVAILCMAVGIAIPSFVHGWAEQPLKNYKRDYKERFMPKLAKALGGFKFYPQRGISKKLIDKTGVMPPYDRYYAEDCFMGKYKGTKVIFSEARLHRGGSATPVFDGIFILMEMANLKISGHSILTSDHNMIGHYASSRWKKLSPMPLKADKTTSINFKLFSSQPDAAKALDKERLFQELEEASHIFDNAPITLVAFGQKYLFMMLPYSHNMFEAYNVHVPIPTKQHMTQSNKEIDQLLEIIDVIDVFQDEER